MWTARRRRFHEERKGRREEACLPEAEVMRRRSVEGEAGMVGWGRFRWDGEELMRREGALRSRGRSNCGFI